MFFFPELFEDKPIELKRCLNRLLGSVRTDYEEYFSRRIISKISNGSLQRELQKCTKEAKPVWAGALILDFDVRNGDLSELLGELAQNHALLDEYYFKFTKMFFEQSPEEAISLVCFSSRDKKEIKIRSFRAKNYDPQGKRDVVQLFSTSASMDLSQILWDYTPKSKGFGTANSEPYNPNENSITYLNFLLRKRITTPASIMERNQHAALLGFLNVVEEDRKYFVGKKGTYILYLLLSSKNEKGELLVQKDEIKSCWKRYFLFKRTQAKLRIHWEMQLYCEFIVMCQLILNKVGVLDTCEFVKELKSDLRKKGDKICQKFERFEPAFYFVPLHEKNIQKKAFAEKRDDYLHTVTNINLLTQFFYDGNF